MYLSYCCVLWMQWRIKNEKSLPMRTELWMTVHWFTLNTPRSGWSMALQRQAQRAPAKSCGSALVHNRFSLDCEHRRPSRLCSALRQMISRRGEGFQVWTREGKFSLVQLLMPCTLRADHSRNRWYLWGSQDGEALISWVNNHCTQGTCPVVLKGGPTHTLECRLYPLTVPVSRDLSFSWLQGTNYNPGTVGQKW